MARFAVTIIGCLAITATASDPSMQLPDVDYTVAWEDETPMPIGLSDATASTVGSKIYLIGGCDSPNGNENAGDFYACNALSDVTHIYDTGARTWSTGAAMPSDRLRHAAAVHGDHIYIVGGRGANDALIKTVIRYDTTASTWEEIINDFTEATSDNAAFFDGDMLYVCGGYNEDYSVVEARCFMMDVTAASPAFTASSRTLQTGRGDHRIVVLDNKAYCVGGFDSTFSHLASMEVLDLSSSSSTWTFGPAVTHPRGDFAMAAYNSRVLVIGGEDGSDDSLTVTGIALRVVEVFDPAANSWLANSSQVALPHEVFRFSAATAAGKVYIFGGQLAKRTDCNCYPTDVRVFSYEETMVVLGAAERTFSFHAAFAWCLLASMALFAVY
mmetsp:Transcript_11358/g.26203  ORF Transcript_11358/g.26203 Transcript_11358/m.26203 type:complete len:385 (-) Transcript_11358:164-1318(-)|eukprot:CAMPEP_0178416162 /NCGR_PEP_ID=MMETSP0689_2-20121128/23921_1 /TAXON_ID=160604 /ORGANISM="Amphidinium massartii, Strain CS-259" /LENGTH=384 /DNA_ID=CAMNT_0020037497 /DNA_START=72 /DNA_END=1226 /DNA_ORIENTATION=-